MKSKITIKLEDKKIQILKECAKWCEIDSIENLIIITCEKMCHDYLVVKKEENTLNYNKLQECIDLLRNQDCPPLQYLSESEMNLAKDILDKIDKENLNAKKKINK